MRDQLMRRLSELRNELGNGQQLLAKLDTRRDELSRSMLRIGGAIHVLEEILTPGNQNSATVSSHDTSPRAATPLGRVVG